MDNLQAIERFSRLEACITLAAQACHASDEAPQALDATLSELETRAHEARALVQGQAGTEAEDPARLFECADRLKSLGDQAELLCEQADGLDGGLRQRIREARDEIAHFRRQLHGEEMRRESRPQTRH
ncbi:MAG: hypothetical protein AB1430_17735 [Pseudomonadota bacterium]